MIRLTDLEKRVFEALDTRRGQDVDIGVIHAAAYGFNGPELTVREMQQQLGAAISRINTKMKKGRIKPGRMKQTYRLDVFQSPKP